DSLHDALPSSVAGYVVIRIPGSTIGLPVVDGGTSGAITLSWGSTIGTSESGENVTLTNSPSSSRFATATPSAAPPNRCGNALCIIGPSCASPLSAYGRTATPLFSVSSLPAVPTDPTPPPDTAPPPARRLATTLPRAP